MGCSFVIRSITGRIIGSAYKGHPIYLFAGSHDGARRAAVLYTLINTCKIHGVNPYCYLCDVLPKVHTHPASRISELTPLAWKENLR